MLYREFRNEREFINGRCRTISGHFFANCINIFHKTEDQTVILIGLMEKKLNWFKSYDTKCTLKPRKILAKSGIDYQNLHLINGHFCANHMKIFHKTEIQMVILRCWTSLNPWLVQQLWPKTQKKQKTQKTQMHFFLQYHKKPEVEIFAFWVITF